jgi:hypothetical protein
MACLYSRVIFYDCTVLFRLVRQRRSYSFSSMLTIRPLTTSYRGHVLSCISQVVYASNVGRSWYQRINSSGKSCVNHSHETLTHIHMKYLPNFLVSSCFLPHPETLECYEVTALKLHESDSYLVRWSRCDSSISGRIGLLGTRKKIRQVIQFFFLITVMEGIPLPFMNFNTLILNVL